MIMEWFDTEERRQITETAERFARTEFAGREPDPAVKVKSDIPWEAIESAGELGLLAGPLPQDLGGIELDALSEILLLERIAGGSAGVAAILAVHTAGLRALAELRDVPAVRSWIEQIRSDKRRGPPALVGLAVPEPVKERQKPDSLSGQHQTTGGNIPIQGSFICLLDASAASGLIVVDYIGASAMRLVRMDCKDAEEYSVPSYPGSGLEELPVARLKISGLVPREDDILCKGKAAATAGKELLIHLRLALAAVQMGNAEAAWRLACDYAEERFQTGRPIIEHQEVRKMLTSMELLLQAGRSLLTRGAACTDDPLRQEQLAIQADRFCGSSAELICLDAIQVLGGYGYMKDYGLEKCMRDCKTLQALLGSYTVDWLGGLNNGFI